MFSKFVSNVRLSHASRLFGKTSWVDDIGPEMIRVFSEVFSLFGHPITLGFEGSTKT